MKVLVIPDVHLKPWLFDRAAEIMNEEIAEINSLGMREMWDDASPLWLRPQYYYEKMYKETELLQVVGHTPVMQIDRLGNVLTCDLFSTYRTGDPIGTQEFLLINTETWEYEGIK